MSEEKKESLGCPSSGPETVGIKTTDRASIASLEKDKRVCPLSSVDEGIGPEESSVTSLSLQPRTTEGETLEGAHRGGVRSTLAPDDYDSITVSSTNSLTPGAIRVAYRGPGDISHRQVVRFPNHHQRATGNCESLASSAPRVEDCSESSTSSARLDADGDPLVSAVLVSEDGTNSSTAAVAFAPPPAAVATPIPEDYVLTRKASFDSTKAKRCHRALAFLGIASAVLAAIIIPVAIIVPKKQKSSPSRNEASDAKNEGRDNVTRAERYWDCSGGACGCAHLPTGDPEKPRHCYSNAMFQAPAGNEWGANFYGTAAISEDLGGSWWLGSGCGKCWKLTGNGNVDGFFSKRSTIVVKAANFCAPDKCGQENHFKIAAPGFESDPETLFSACDNETEKLENLEAYTACVGWMTGNSTDPADNCKCEMFTVPALRKGCENFLSLGWDDAVVEYEALDVCPPELGRLPCWEENGDNYPEGLPALCESPDSVVEKSSFIAQASQDVSKIDNIFHR